MSHCSKEFLSRYIVRVNIKNIVSSSVMDVCGSSYIFCCVRCDIKLGEDGNSNIAMVSGMNGPCYAHKHELIASEAANWTVA